MSAEPTLRKLGPKPMRIPPVILLALAPGVLIPNLLAQNPTSPPNVVPTGVLSVSDPDLEVTLWA